MQTAYNISQFVGRLPNYGEFTRSETSNLLNFIETIHCGTGSQYGTLLIKGAQLPTTYSYLALVFIKIFYSHKTINLKKISKKFAYL